MIWGVLSRKWVMYLKKGVCVSSVFVVMLSIWVCYHSSVGPSICCLYKLNDMFCAFQIRQQRERVGQTSALNCTSELSSVILVCGAFFEKVVNGFALLLVAGSADRGWCELALVKIVV